MKINLKTKIKSLEGKVMQQDVNGVLADVEIKNLFLIALQQESNSDSMDTKRKAFELMVSLSSSKDSVEMKSEDVTLLKTKCYNSFNSLVAGQLELILEGKEIPF